MERSSGKLVSVHKLIVRLRACRWFKPHPPMDAEYFTSRIPAITIEEAWDKTFKKWQLIMEGLAVHYDRATCGLCDMYNDKSDTQCTRCPIYAMTGREGCTDTPCSNVEDTDPELEYLFLLFVKEATKDDEF